MHMCTWSMLTERNVDCTHPVCEDVGPTSLRNIGERSPRYLGDVDEDARRRARGRKCLNANITQIRYPGPMHTVTPTCWRISHLLLPSTLLHGVPSRLEHGLQDLAVV
ncbi:hypothetical protein C8Q78DRAFT_1062834 [Trametes maxima]|nr:hypothetical protein C8Q78DRAFT_1062834 [Trametes maxima]